MKLVINTEVMTNCMSRADVVRLIADAGFDGLDCSLFDLMEDDSDWLRDDWKERALQLRAVAEECGLVFRQAHAPFPSARGKEPYDTVIRERIIRAIEVAAALGIENIVVHPIHYTKYFATREEQFSRSVEFYKSLMPYCEQLGIRVCTENMWDVDKAKVIRDSLCARPEEFMALVDAVDHPWMGACLDIGHAALVGQDPANMIRRMGSYIDCLHVHDVDYLHDKHTMPFTQDLDWEEIATALGQIGYRGDFTYEANVFIKKMPQALWPDALKMMAAVGRYIISRIEANYPEN